MLMPKKLGYGEVLKKMRTNNLKVLADYESNNQSDLEELFLFQMKACRIPMPQRRVQFHPTRKFEWDYVWPSIKFWVEIDGGEWMKKGAHNTGKGIRRDREKDCEAFLLGWKGLRFCGSQVTDGTAVKYLESIIERGLFK
jgi:very-short-patch-repair endonuclease